jgi:RNA-directed DNA polymerase
MTNKSERLRLFGLPLLTSLQSLAEETHLSKGLLFRLCKFSEKHYARYEIPKASGGSRVICAPSGQMKAVQAWILRTILEKIPVSREATAFVRGKGILENIRPHKGNRFFLCMDIEDFFPSITLDRVQEIFRRAGYDGFISYALASLCTCGRRLPQGGVTSPVISNIVCKRLDKRISRYVGKRDITYTRYADDMTFSAMSAQRLASIESFVAYIIRDEGFVVNVAKTRLLGPRQSRRITGLVVSHEGIGVGRQVERLLRAKISNSADASACRRGTSERVSHIQGWLSYMRYVDEMRYQRLLEYSKKLGRRRSVNSMKFS